MSHVIRHPSTSHFVLHLQSHLSNATQHAMQSSSDEPKTFTLFPKLPPELQEAIWARTIDWEPHVLPRPPIPELSVCRQAREVLLKIYRPCFHSDPGERRNDLQFSGREGRGPEVRYLTIRGMGTPFPRSPYANYSTDILHLTSTFMSQAHKEGSCQIFLFQEAIDNIQNLVTWRSFWPDSAFRHGGPARRRGMPPLPPLVDSKLVITHFGALKVLYIAEEPKVQVDFPPLDEDLKFTAIIARFQAKDPNDELIAPALKAVYAEKKILIPQGESDQDPRNSNRMYFAKRWMERQSTAFPDWKAPDLQFAKLIPDPRG
jgi:hypothetical protein